MRHRGTLYHAWWIYSHMRSSYLVPLMSIIDDFICNWFCWETFFSPHFAMFYCKCVQRHLRKIYRHSLQLLHKRSTWSIAREISHKNTYILLIDREIFHAIVFDHFSEYANEISNVYYYRQGAKNIYFLHCKKHSFFPKPRKIVLL